MDGEIAPEEVERALEDENAPLVVDIRSPAAYKQGHIPGSRNIPFGDLPDAVESLTDVEHIVTVCPHGKASVQAARLIGSYEGIDDARVDSMAGGLAEWPSDLETEDDTESATAEGDADAAAGEPTDAPF